MSKSVPLQEEDVITHFTIQILQYTHATSI